MAVIESCLRSIRFIAGKTSVGGGLAKRSTRLVGPRTSKAEFVRAPIIPTIQNCPQDRFKPGRKTAFISTAIKGFGELAAISVAWECAPFHSARPAANFSHPPRHTPPKRLPAMVDVDGSECDRLQLGPPLMLAAYLTVMPHARVERRSEWKSHDSAARGSSRRRLRRRRPAS